MDEPRIGGDHVKLAEALHESGVKDLPSNAVIDSAEFVDISLISTTKLTLNPSLVAYPHPYPNPAPVF